ncbi:MAG TPA: hypothetical protein PLD59_14415, partial [Tepidisphaeraceae bacterium]|nr:hypothetical protein [Tepidisphaeraceae bacterium]
KRAMKQPVPLGNESIAGATAMGLAAIPAPARRAPRPATTTAPHATKAPPKVAAKPLSYQRGTTQRDRERTSIANTIEMVRDCYVPVALLIIGFVACLAAYLFRANASGESLAFIGLGLGGFMAVKALLMLGFAFLVAGPVGVSFGGIWTAILKLAAIAIFTDGAITWIHLGLDKLLSIRGMFAAMVSFPIALGLFWVLLIYLFSMDPGDSWLVVILLCVFDYVVRLALLMIVLAMVMRGL